MSDYNGGSPTGKKLKEFMIKAESTKKSVAKKMGKKPGMSKETMKALENKDFGGFTRSYMK